MRERPPLERFGVVGFNHRLIPARLRGQLAFDRAWCADLATRLREAHLADGVAFVSTCNRQEVVLSAEHPAFAIELVKAQLQSRLAEQVGAETLPEPYRHVGEEAVRHVLRVSASLDSLVVGERQITQQLRRAFDDARASGALDKPLNGLAHLAVSTAKEIHHRTALATESVGVFSIARELILRETAGIARPRVAVLGLGEIGLKTARALVSDGRVELVLSSRRLRAGGELGGSLENVPRVPFEELPRLLATCDAIVVATGAGRPVIEAEALRSAREAVGSNRLVLVDLGIPPQVETECDGVAGTALFNLDWFTTTGFGQRPAAREALQQANTIVDEGVRRVAEWVAVRRWSGLFDSCVVLTDQYKSQVVPELLRGELAGLPPEQQRLVSSAMHRLLTQYSEGIFQTLSRALHQPAENGTGHDGADSR